MFGFLLEHKVGKHILVAFSSNFFVRKEIKT